MEISSSYLRSEELRAKVDVTKRRVDTGEITREQGYEELARAVAR
ncbi:hypothetical protein [Sphingomonas sp.]